MHTHFQNAIKCWVDNGNEQTFKAVVSASYESAKEKPRFRHDCESCLFFGNCGELDLYVCLSKRSWKRDHPNLDSMILRAGNVPNDYYSFHPPDAFADPKDFVKQMEKNYPEYIELLKRYKEAGLYKGNL